MGRPRKLSAQLVTQTWKLVESGDETHALVAAPFGVDVATLRRALRGRMSAGALGGEKDGLLERRTLMLGAGAHLRNVDKMI